jgi:CheY-like chemotaxis protein
MNETPENRYPCPYCGRPLQWVAYRTFGRGTFDCMECGDFPDMATIPSSTSSSTKPAPYAPASGVRAHQRGWRPRVLLVDDSPEYRNLYAALLQETATVVTASRGEEALAIAATEPLDAILLDVMMPGLDGWETCERLKSAPATRNIPVIMLTSVDGLDVPATASRVGAASVVIKPCSIERLTLAIQAAVSCS